MKTKASKSIGNSFRIAALLACGLAWHSAQAAGPAKSNSAGSAMAAAIGSSTDGNQAATGGAAHSPAKGTVSSGGSAAAGGPASLPAFSLLDLDGKQWTNSKFAGKALVVDFWATWCNTCKETIPKLAELNDKYKDKGLTVIGISVDKGSAEKIRKSAQRFGINYLVLLDKENSLGKSFGFNGIPSLYVFNKRGELKTAMPGYDPDQEGQLTAAAEAVMH